MATKGTSKLARQLSAIAGEWPKDPFRPHLLLPTFLESLSKHPRLTSEAVQAAQALKKDQANKKYPLSSKILKPASKPLHYDRLVEGFQKSAQGIHRPWWKVFFGIW
ncbi:hypothetical protein BDP27DRAFT_1416362 [Rhodocollybia butyracea]|uniref:Uncharacterized protein n=1 Tax=Rhodocollybia butyracea TaxID=206335 RepID=A0A9P5Q2V9_9AGAR|nr:hypothetical protein BDP27DRAFT_1416362 [Rhodocollybia butyracea]